jgi:hypothetical protein
MGMNFPNSPTTGQLFPATPVAGQPVYRWNGVAWDSIGFASSGGVFFGDAPPASPADGALWWNSANAQLYIRYNDGNSSQWVVVVSAPSVPSYVAVASAYDNIAINPKINLSQSGFTNIALATGVPQHGPDGYRAQFNTATGGASFGISPTSGQPRNYMYLQCTTAFSAMVSGDMASLWQCVEGIRIDNLRWGSSDARPLNYAFMCYSDVAGTTFLKVMNGAANRSFYREFTVAVGWNFISGSIPGDTTGTWPNNNTTALYFQIFATGKETSPAAPEVWSANMKFATTNSQNLFATSGKAFGISHLWLSEGPNPPSQNDLPYLMRPDADEQRICARYFQLRKSQGAGEVLGACQAFAATAALGLAWTFPVMMRTQPTLTMGPTGNDFAFLDAGTTAHVVTGVTSSIGTLYGYQINWSCGGGLTAPGITYLQFQTANGNLTADARLQ